MNEITDFLNSAQDYLQGIALVKKYCPNKTDLIKRFEKCESTYNREKIAFLLGKVAPLPPKGGTEEIVSKAPFGGLGG